MSANDPIVFQLPLGASRKKHMKDIRDAEIVIENGMVTKDRYGLGNRAPTVEEIAKAAEYDRRVSH